MTASDRAGWPARQMLERGKSGWISLLLPAHYFPLHGHPSSPLCFLQLRLDGYTFRKTQSSIALTTEGKEDLGSQSQNITGYCSHVATSMCVCISKGEEMCLGCFTAENGKLWLKTKAVKG